MAEGRIPWVSGETWKGSVDPVIYIYKANLLHPVYVPFFLDNKAYMGFQYGAYHDFTGPRMGDYHLLLKEIKKVLDKNDLSNPGRFAQINPKKESKDSYYSRMNRE